MGSLNEVLNILQSACSTNHQEVKLAEQAVGEWELKQGFFPLIAVSYVSLIVTEFCFLFR